MSLVTFPILYTEKPRLGTMKHLTKKSEVINPRSEIYNQADLLIVYDFNDSIKGTTREGGFTLNHHLNLGRKRGLLVESQEGGGGTRGTKLPRRHLWNLCG